MFIVRFHGAAHREDPNSRGTTLCRRTIENGLRLARAATNRCAACERKHKTMEAYRRLNANAVQSSIDCK